MSKRQKGPLPYPAPGIGAAWIGDSPIFGFGDGMLKLGEARVQCHDGGMLAMQASPDGQSIWTAGDDGRLVQVDSQGQVHERLHVPRKWLDSLAISTDGSFVAVAAGQTVHVVGQNGGPQELRPPKGPTALTFAHDRQELAITHSGGVSLFELPSGELVQEIPCAGGPISVAYGADDAFLFVGLSEPALAGWRLQDGQAFKMGGYPAKPRHLVQNKTGSVLLTSGGPALLAWPIVAGKGPMGQSAGVYRPRLGLVTAVAIHETRVLVGWSDGGVDQVDLSSGKTGFLAGPRPRTELLDDPRKMRRSILSLAFHASGKRLAYVGEDGSFGHQWLQ
ncbi:hypothetical protein [Aquidulcibacter sp.]|uniref:WD40 repeat domain-containing protein n=1 Tax=Aquidulcibacter sp. TaxID=2052990 RepID=UPI0028A9E9E2|nr:hypothetical protein [Aquidulcibacter sp.]